MRLILFVGWMGLFVIFILPLFLSLFKKTVPRENTLEKGSDMVRDQICGVYIPKERAEISKSGGKVYYFCSKECQEKFYAESR